MGSKYSIALMELELQTPKNMYEEEVAERDLSPHIIAGDDDGSKGILKGFVWNGNASILLDGFSSTNPRFFNQEIDPRLIKEQEPRKYQQASITDLNFITSDVVSRTTKTRRAVGMNLMLKKKVSRGKRALKQKRSCGGRHYGSCSGTTTNTSA
ncbi:hypothetical protein H4219_003851 [Mycoemilia scoparia]|uniref:Uncharacterized protein n=1 Tax=Mycoemilia scoparia TaxID=417184 RepID=A0A9W8DNQ0_9FUNG|nr:hypothetical protein H4219_003851 [Mycoemilia scoparia]